VGGMEVCCGVPGFGVSVFSGGASVAAAATTGSSAAASVFGVTGF
jgi:hypothetical protein